MTDLIKQLLEFDWLGHTHVLPGPIPLKALKDETPHDRKLRMLEQLSHTCRSCSMCELGTQEATRNNQIYDPHVFSNMNLSRYILIGQGPGWDEVRLGQPFVGASGQNLDIELQKHGLSRNDFYIANTIRCFTTNNTKPTDRHISRCKPFLDIEINLMRPLLLVTLGSVAFGAVCPGLSYSESLGKICKSRYDIKTLPIYHPSPLNLSDIGRRAAFSKQIKLLAIAIKHLNCSNPGF